MSAESKAGFQKEPEFTAADGTVRKAHYGSGKQPWDTIKELGWGPIFAAGNALKYVRRFTAKNGADDLEKGRWYYAELVKMAGSEKHNMMRPMAKYILIDLKQELTAEEFTLLAA